MFFIFLFFLMYCDTGTITSLSFIDFVHQLGRYEKKKDFVTYFA